jgi:ATP-dependent RNA helicase DDX10/DBP4
MTTGRLLHHFETTPQFNCDNLRILVLDEADRILDLGFQKALTAILSYMPKQRQTLLFSATQTKSVQDIARLSLRNPEWVFVHEKSGGVVDHSQGGSDAKSSSTDDKASISSTPNKLVQFWTEVPLPGKLDVLWSFVKGHLKQKTLVFLTSCKQVSGLNLHRLTLVVGSLSFHAFFVLTVCFCIYLFFLQVKYVYEIFRRQRPGVPVMCLHGRQKQGQRLDVFYSFCQKQHGEQIKSWRARMIA